MKKIVSLLLVTGLLAACAGRQAPPPAAAGTDGKTLQPAESGSDGDYDGYELVALIPDPIEPVNRGLFAFNHGLYYAVFRPVSKGYKFLIPRPVREGIGNAFANIRFPIRLVNDLLQARFGDAGLETGKFLLNTTVGLGGLLRVSDKFPALADLPDADTGQTLARWGVPHGVYIVLPVLGPSSLRETVGIAGDTALNPVAWTGFIFGGGVFWGGPAWTSAVSGAHTMSALPDRVDAYETITQSSLDRYLAARSAWAQYREAKARKAVSRSELGGPAKTR
jgi:phospholipid-binding lipoprotein MlaA